MNRELQAELFQEIKEKNDIVSVVSEYVTLKRAGRSMSGLCPFHSEKTGSFNVNPDKQFFYCFGCGTGGDVISFLMKIENLDFIEASRRLADRAGIVWPQLEQSETERKKELLFKINKLAALFYHQCLIKMDLGKKASDYLLQRGIKLEVWQQFDLGYALPGWQHLTDTLRKKDISLETAESLGLISFGENGYYDRFRERVIFPIADARGNIVGFGGRVLDNSHPKYLNSPETALFHKGHFLYGLQLAKDTIRRKDQTIVVEGYMDVIQAHQAGFTQTVASLGTALTKEQAKLIKRFSNRVVLAYDADTAGANATVKGMEILQEAGLEVRILRLPPGYDPDSFIQEKGAPSFEKMLTEAASLTEFKISLALQEFDLANPEGQVAAVQAVLPQLAALDSNIARETYIRRISREIGTSETAILAELRQWQNNNRKNSQVLDRINHNRDTKETMEKLCPASGLIPMEKLTPLQKAIFEAEKEVLQIALQEYDKFKRIKEELKAETFRFEIWRSTFNELERIFLNSEKQSFNLAELDQNFREIVSGLIAEFEIKNCHSDTSACINRLKMLQLQEQIKNLTDEISSGRNRSGQSLSETELKERIKDFTDLKRRLQKEFPQFTAEIY